MKVIIMHQLVRAFERGWASLSIHVLMPVLGHALVSASVHALLKIPESVW